MARIWMPLPDRGFDRAEVAAAAGTFVRGPRRAGDGYKFARALLARL